jgi:hypothetical protein
MARAQPTNRAAWLIRLAPLLVTPAPVVAQAPRAESPTVVVAEQPRSAPAETWLPIVADAAAPSRRHRSAAGTIALHTAVGTGAGLVTGLVLSGAAARGDRTTVVVTWTTLGAAAGAVSGVVTWLLGRRS